MIRLGHSPLFEFRSTALNRWISVCCPISFFILLIFELSVALTPVRAEPQVDLTQKNVLILYSEEKSHPAHELTDRGIRSVFLSNHLFEVRLYDEHLDGSRFKDPAITHAFADYLRLKYAGLKIDTIIVVYWKAMDFLLKEAVGVFPKTPIVVTQLTRARTQELERLPRAGSITGTMFGENINDFLAAAFQMMPRAKRVGLVSGINPSEIYTEQLFRKGLEPYLKKLELIDLTRKPMPEILSRVGSLPPDTIVFFSNMFTDGAGQNFVPREALKLISRAANAPVFGLFDSYLGYGIVGGLLVSFEEHGREAAVLALRVMGGESPASIPFRGEKAYISAYDWRELRRWKMSEVALPKGSIVINREVTFWDFKFYIIGAAAFFLLETALIIFLIVQRRRRKLAEESLREKTEELDQFFNVNLDLLCIANTDGYFLRLNPSWERILGHTREELTRKQFLDFVHPDDLDETRKAVSTLASQQKLSWFENRYRCKDGTYRWLQWNCTPAGKLIYAAARDITEHKETEEALRQSEERLRLLIEESIVPIGINQRGVIRYVNKKYLEMFGYENENEVLGKSVLTQWAEESHKEIKDRMRRLKQNLPVSPEFEGIGLRKDGSKRNVQLAITNVDLKDGPASIAFFTDVTERRRAEEELRRHHEHLEEVVNRRTADLIMARDEAEAANRAKSEFLANMSHELRTPLNSILGIAQLMERDPGFPDAYRDTLKILSGSGTHLLELINDVLELSKIEAGKIKLEITSFDLRSFLGDLEEMMRLRAHEKHLKLLFEYHSPLPQYIETDVRKLRQILINLLGNAIKYTDKGGVTLRVVFHDVQETIWKTATSSAPRLKFEVEDTGIGIAAEDMERIFQSFVQLNPGRTATEGTGLGLTLSRRFVELLGGEMRLRSQLGKGSTFSFQFPVKLAEAATVHTQEKGRQVIQLMPGQPHYRLLVVDDSIENRLVLRRLLEQVGFEVLEAASGQEAIEMHMSGEPSLIWMDVRMPGMDGNEAARRIREVESGKEIHTPIIAFTAGVMKEARPASDSQVFDGFVYKPFREAEIFQILEKHLGVNFVYQPSIGLADTGEQIWEVEDLRQADLLKLSGDWLKEFYGTLKKGRSAQLFKLIDEIRPAQGELADALAGLVRIHRFDQLIAATEGALQEIDEIEPEKTKGNLSDRPIS